MRVGSSDLDDSAKGKLEVPMLALMQLLEKEGTHFLDKMVITVAGTHDLEPLPRAVQLRKGLETVGHLEGVHKREGKIVGEW